jgi:hypothetical protein
MKRAHVIDFEPTYFAELRGVRCIDLVEISKALTVDVAVVAQPLGITGRGGFLGDTAAHEQGRQNRT